jgi:DNA repair protein RadC
VASTAVVPSDGHFCRMDGKMMIRDWSPEDRPREKCLLKGARGLSTTECLAILLRNGAQGKTALGLAQELWKLHGEDLYMLEQGRPEKWMRISGLGKAKAATLAAAFELGRRMGTPVEPRINQHKARVRGSYDAFRYLKSALLALDHEEFWVLYLSRACDVKALECIGKGGWTATMADIRVVFQRALELCAPAIIIAHNHPSGQLTPSVEDKALTERIAEAGRFLEIDLLDHLIVGHGDYVSFADKGWLASARTTI